jgi:hypothetical protein
MSSYDGDWFTSTGSQYNNPEMYPPPNYPVNFSSQTNLSQEFDYNGYGTYGSSSPTQGTGTEGVGDGDGVDGDEEGNDVEVEESRGRRLIWTEEDNIRLVSCFANAFFFIAHTWFKQF